VSRKADMTKAAKRIVFSKFLNNGQVCAATDYVLVERAVFDTFVAALRKMVKTCV
jgi:aldehyde dehydrogenase (NAD+)